MPRPNTYRRKRKGPGRPRKRGRPRTTGKYIRKVPSEINQIKKIVQSKEKAWTKKKPHGTIEMTELLSTCGTNCFLDKGVTQTNDYAVCAKCSKTDCLCYPDCDGLLFVKRLAAHRGIDYIEQIAQSLADELGCDWSTAIKYILQSQYSNTLSLI